MMDMADELLERTAKLDPNEDRVLEDLMRGLLNTIFPQQHRNVHHDLSHLCAQTHTRALINSK